MGAEGTCTRRCYTLKTYFTPIYVFCQLISGRRGHVHTEMRETVSCFAMAYYYIPLKPTLLLYTLKTLLCYYTGARNGVVFRHGILLCESGMPLIVGLFWPCLRSLLTLTNAMAYHFANQPCTLVHSRSALVFGQGFSQVDVSATARIRSRVPL